MKKIFLILVCVFLLWDILHTQSLEERMELFEDGTYFYESEDYNEAVFYFRRLYDYDPENGNICFLVGTCYLNITGEETKAIPYLEKAVDRISYYYSKSTFQEVRAPLHAMFYLGNAYRINNQLKEALDIYDKFLNSPYFEGNYNLDIVNNEMEACKRAKIIQDKPVKIERTNLGYAINDANDNFNPVVSGNGSTLVFVTSLKFYDAIMMSALTDTGWSYPVNITPQVGSDGDCYPVCLSYDGKELYLVKKDKRNSDIYLSHWEMDKWTMKEMLGKSINTAKSETHASISEDGQLLYFTSERGSKGGLDIYVSKRESASDWGKAESMGKNINTDFDEDCPFLSEDGKVLFFSSKGHNNMGGYDIFYSIYRKGKWSIPVNIGYPINTTGDDKFYAPIGKGLVSHQALILDEGYGKKDIYRVKITGGDNYQELQTGE